MSSTQFPDVEVARRRIFCAALVALLSLIAAIAPAAVAATPHPAWSLTTVPFPANFKPGEVSDYIAMATNVGGAPTSATSPSVVEMELPAGITPRGVENAFNTDKDATGADLVCGTSGQTMRCETSEPVGPGRQLRINFRLEISASASEEELQVPISVEGGGAAGIEVDAPLPVRSEPVQFGFQPPLTAPGLNSDGTPETEAGAHPYQQNLDFGFPIRRSITDAGVALWANSGHPHDLRINLPRGLLVNPSASPVLCTEAQLTGVAGACPMESQVGTVDLTTLVGTQGVVLSSPLYDLVPPPGHPAEFAFNAADAGIYVHILGEVNSEGEFELEAQVPDIPALASNPFFNINTQLWGDPSAAAHDRLRGLCLAGNPGQTCPVEAQHVPFLTSPGACSGGPLEFTARSDSWEDPGTFLQSDYQSSDLAGDPISLAGCSQLEFKPTVTVVPTTNLIDSPSGLEVDVHQPQQAPAAEPLSGRASAILRDAAVTLPPGLTVNASQADGLGACEPGQVGLTTAVGETPIRFSKAPATCPEASKLGTVTVSSPLLAERDAEQKLVRDPETGAAVPEPLHGSVYLAKPFDNPFDSLLAIYLTVEDEKSGILAKLAGRIEPDPQTGQLTTRFAESPQLPIEDIDLHLFGGARGALITPPTCGINTTTTDLVPWSAPEGAADHPSDSFQTTQEPGGGACPQTEAAAPNSPAFTAGTLNPQAGAFSPFVLKISREDGSQRLTAIDTTLAPGLIGKLAGIPECSEAQIAQAQARSRPEEGALERERPSCPASTEVGTVAVAAGAGPTPLYTQGHAYLAGPYKGAPVSLVTIVPAIAGPFDLGTVVTRVALQVEPETARIHAVSDPLPTILDGLPLDIRSIALTMDRPQFTLNPTSCDPLSITGRAISALGQSAALTTPFQVGGCSTLPFRPKLALRLKGKVKRTSHPTLIANLTAKAGEANVAQAQVKLPASVFLDQGNIKTVCTRVQWAADTCPAGSVYGTAEATTPLLGYPISGSVYLRSSNHKLPDLVVKLKGPASQPIEIDLDGRTDSVKGALRNTFEAVPDAPVSSFRLELFGGKRGLVEMSSGFCSARKATVNLTGQNGKTYDTAPTVAAKCPKPKKAHKRHHAKHRRASR